MENPKCPNCGTDLIDIPGKSYKACPNWKPNGAGCQGTVWWPPNYRKSNYPNKAFSYRVESKSNPEHFHTVIVYESGDMDCPCEAGQMNKFCRHKTEILKAIKDLVAKIEKENGLGVK